MLLFATILIIYYFYQQMSPEELLDIIREQQKQIDFLIQKLENNAISEKIEKLILEKTKPSFRVPNVRSIYTQDFDFSKGIKYIIEKSTKITVGNVPQNNIMLPENAKIINPNTYYEIQFYVCSGVPGLPFIPIYDMYSRKSPEKSNIFHIDDTTLRFVPKIFVEILFEKTGETDVVEVVLY